MPPPELRSPEVEQEAMPRPMRARTMATRADLENMAAIPVDEDGREDPDLE